MKYFSLIAAFAVSLVFPLAAETVLAPDLGAGKLDYVQSSGKKVYADLREGKPIFKNGALELRNQELAYDTEGVVSLNNGTLSFDIEPLNFDGKNWKPGENRYITLFAVATDAGYTQLWLYLYPHGKGIGTRNADQSNTALSVGGAHRRNGI